MATNSNINQVFGNIKKQITFAGVQAINDTVVEITKQLKVEAPRVFDRPTPHTLRGFLFKKATKSNPVGKVFINDWPDKGVAQEKFLAPEVFGGQRRAKKSEILMRQKGILPNDMYWTPGRNMRLDRYGNVTGGRITQILSVLKAHNDPYQNTTENSKKRNKAVAKLSQNIFVSRGDRGLSPGIFTRKGKGKRGKVNELFRFVSSTPTYRKRLPYHKFVREITNKVFNERFQVRFAEAMRTAR